MHGTAYANKAVAGLRISSWPSVHAGTIASPASCQNFCRDAVKIHVDVDRAEFGKILTPDLACPGMRVW